MKLGGNLSPGPDALLFSRSGLFILFVSLLNVSAKSKGYVEAGDHDDDEIRSYGTPPRGTVRLKSLKGRDVSNLAVIEDNRCSFNQLDIPFCLSCFNHQCWQ